VPAHTLVSPNIQYNNRDIKTPDRAGDWNLTNTKFHTVMPVAAGQSPLHWACLNITDISEPNEHLIPSLNQFTEVLRHTGINIRKPQYLKSMTVNEPMDRYFNEICGIKGIQILLVLIPPENNTAIYNRVKVLGDIEKSLHTVCVKASDDKFFSQSPSYYANVALKFNLKLRGVNHVIDSKIDGSETMVVGIDVTHPSPGSEGAPSIAAMVASIDKEFAQWPVDLRIQRAWNEMKKDEKSAQDGARQEMVSDIYEMLRSRLKLWQNRHKGTLPKNILIYRDGVSESQYQQVLSIELTAMKRACADTYGKQQPPKITIIIVGKRHHTRFFPTLSHQADSSHNTPRGTLVDRTLFSAPSWEFFLQSHTALQGTVRPAHYVVIYDEIFRAGKVLPYCCSNAAEWLEAVTNDLCFLFGRATKAVSIPAPVYYADVACGRARRWLGEVFVGEGGGGKRELGYGELQRRITPEGRLRDEMFYV